MSSVLNLFSDENDKKILALGFLYRNGFNICIEKGLKLNGGKTLL